MAFLAFIYVVYVCMYVCMYACNVCVHDMQVDDAAAPLDFVYVTSHVAGEKVVLSNFGWFNPTLKVSRYKRKT